MDNNLEHWKLKNIIISLVFVVVGLVLFLLSTQNSGIIYSILAQFGSIIMITATWNVIYDMKLRSQFVEIISSHTEKISEKIDLAKQEKDFGLVAIYSKSDGYNFYDFLTENKELVVLLNEGRTWISNHTPKIEERLKKTSFKTTFVVTHPDSSMVAVLAAKQELTAHGITGKVKEFVSSVKAIKGYDKDRIKILGHRYYNPHSVFLGDTRAIITPYHASRGRRYVPLYIFEDCGESSYFQSVKLDMDYLIKDAEDISEIA